MSDRVRQILENQLSVEWGATTPIAWDDFEYKPIPGTDFIRCTLDGVDSETLAMKCQREHYLLSIQVFTEAGLGANNNMLLADTIMGIFFGFSEDTLICTTIVTERVGAYKEWYQRNVMIDVQFDHHF